MNQPLIHICLTPERCLCGPLPPEANECWCIRERDDQLATRCGACLAEMRALDQRTGEFLTKPKTKGHTR